MITAKPSPCSEKKRSPSPRPSPPGRGRSYCLSLEHSLNGDPCGRRQWVLPLLGERAGVRASLNSYCINTVKPLQQSQLRSKFRRRVERASPLIARTCGFSEITDPYCLAPHVRRNDRQVVFTV